MRKNTKNYSKENLCIIPARKGSKGIKNKNIIEFLGKPLIEHTFHIAKKIQNKFDILVSTDSSDVQKIANKYNFYFLGKRPSYLSGDKVETKHVLKFELNRIEKLKKKNIKIFFCYNQLVPLEILKRSFHL